MRVNFLPKTVLGKWSVWLIVAFFALLASFFILVATGQRGGETFFSNLALTIPMLFATGCGVAAFITGLIGIIKSRERAILVYLSTAIGFIVLLYLLAEILFPH